MELHRFLSCAADLLFPPYCVSCHAPGTWWCLACRSSVQRVTPEDAIEGLDAVRVCGYYHDPRLRHVIHALKYQGVTALRGDIRLFLATQIPRIQELLPAPRIFVPLPATPRHVRLRGFDQAVFLATLLADMCAGETRPLLARKEGSGIPQAQIADERLRHVNVHGVFSVTGDIPRDVSIILVDDVITTGSTACVAAEELRRIGVKHVAAFALARGA